MSMTPQQIDIEQQVGQREISSLRIQVLTLGILFVAALMLCIILIFGMNSRFPMKKYIYTSNAAAVCKFAPLNERGGITDADVLNFATMTAVDVHTFDYINWRKTLDAVTTKRFTDAARDEAVAGLRNSGILPSVVNNSFVLKAVLSGRATIVAPHVENGILVWRVSIPMVLAYTGGRNVIDSSTNYRPENRTILLTVRRAEFTGDNAEGLLVSSMSSTQTMSSPNTPSPEPLAGAISSSREQ